MMSSLCRAFTIILLIGSHALLAQQALQTQTKQGFLAQQARQAKDPSLKSSSTNGVFLEQAMLHYDNVAFLMFVKMGMASYMEKEGKTKPIGIAEEFGLTLRAASAILVTLCRQGIVNIAVDDDYSVDEIEYQLSEASSFFLAHPDEPQTATNYMNLVHDTFATPEILLESMKPKAKEEVDMMSEVLHENDEAKAATARFFIKSMKSLSYSCAEKISPVLGLGGLKQRLTILDVGAGSAVYSIAMAKSNPNIRGIIYELENIKPITEEYIAAEDLSDRIQVVAGDFFTDEPFPQSDLVLMSNIFHDWEDSTNMMLLHKAYDSLRPGGRVVLSEQLLADDVKSSTPASTSFNVVMIRWTVGRHYRGKELTSRLQSVGFVGSYVTSLVDDYSLVVGYKPS